MTAKNKGGRPTLYDRSMIDKAKEYICFFQLSEEDREVLNDLGSARIKLRSLEIGDYRVRKTDEFKLSTIIVGVNNIIANSDSYGGADEELDAEFLNRFMMSHSINNNDDRMGLQAALFNITGVKKCVVYENYTHFTDEKGIPSHSENAVILGGDAEKLRRS